jgi:hypothetical protein
MSTDPLDDSPQSDAPTVPGRAPPPPMETIVALGEPARAQIDALADWYDATFDEALGLVLRFGLGVEEGKLALGEALKTLVNGGANPDDRALVRRIDALATRRGITVADTHAALVRSGLTKLIAVASPPPPVTAATVAAARTLYALRQAKYREEASLVRALVEGTSGRHPLDVLAGVIAEIAPYLTEHSYEEYVAPVQTDLDLDLAAMDKLCDLWPVLRAYAASARTAIADLGDDVIARIDALAAQRGVTREEVLADTVGSGLDVEEGRVLEQPGPGARAPSEDGEHADDEPETKR